MKAIHPRQGGGGGFPAAVAAAAAVVNAARGVRKKRKDSNDRGASINPRELALIQSVGDDPSKPYCTIQRRCSPRCFSLQSSRGAQRGWDGDRDSGPTPGPAASPKSEMRAV